MLYHNCETQDQGSSHLNKTKCEFKKSQIITIQ
jgi:hypothetical protein